MQRDLGNGYVLDDDPARIDRDAVHRYLTGEAYWALGRSREVVDETLDTAARVVGLYHDDQQIGFVRIVSDRHTVAYVAATWSAGTCVRASLRRATESRRPGWRSPPRAALTDAC